MSGSAEQAGGGGASRIAGQTARPRGGMRTLCCRRRLSSCPSRRRNRTLRVLERSLTSIAQILQCAVSHTSRAARNTRRVCDQPAAAAAASHSAHFPSSPATAPPSSTGGGGGGGGCIISGSVAETNGIKRNELAATASSHEKRTCLLKHERASGREDLLQATSHLTDEKAQRSSIHIVLHISAAAPKLT